MFNKWQIYISFVAGGLTSALILWMSYSPSTKPLWVNQEIRERVFVACARNAGVDCGEQAKQIATVGNQSGEILFRPKEGGAK